VALLVSTASPTDVVTFHLFSNVFSISRIFRCFCYFPPFLVAHPSQPTTTQHNTHCTVAGWLAASSFVSTTLRYHATSPTSIACTGTLWQLHSCPCTSVFRHRHCYSQPIVWQGTCATPCNHTSCCSAAWHHVPHTRSMAAHCTLTHYLVGVVSQVGETDIAHFREILGAGAVITDASELQSRNEDWMRKYKGQSSVALLPSTTQHVSQILKYCNSKRCVCVCVCQSCRYW
jgi:hypothetical protein